MKQRRCERTKVLETKSYDYGEVVIYGDARYLSKGCRAKNFLTVIYKNIKFLPNNFDFLFNTRLHFQLLSNFDFTDVLIGEKIIITQTEEG